MFKFYSTVALGIGVSTALYLSARYGVFQPFKGVPFVLPEPPVLLADFPRTLAEWRNNVVITDDDVPYYDFFQRYLGEHLLQFSKKHMVELDLWDDEAELNRMLLVLKDADQTVKTTAANTALLSSSYLRKCVRRILPTARSWQKYTKYCKLSLARLTAQLKSFTLASIFHGTILRHHE
ncbi:uncharacterized protein ARMOST_00280 [Armillaria ostoyae]|uniref:Uncharacterized protein n=1 Tax=Armillaria ostoyae TaxID=47428 RepID=A0A284QKN9_ARMOS|nr:uncharacterized protein ARMOST_00280 [Armillaria ostoyae]